MLQEVEQLSSTYRVQFLVLQAGFDSPFSYTKGKAPRQRRIFLLMSSLGDALKNNNGSILRFCVDV